MAPILEVRNLVKNYGSIAAVKNVSFAIEEGEIFSLLGPNGAGKTTTISVLSTLLSPTSGDVYVGGHSVVSEPMEVRNLIGVVPQEIALYDDLSAQENLIFWGQMYNLSGKALTNRVQHVLQEIELSDRAKDRVRTFSGGMKRRVNIGVGLLHHPKLLFMDEPTVGIDPQSRRAILDSVKALNKQGMTVLYTTHYMEEAQELSDRVGIIDHGELIALGTQHELTRQVGENDALVLEVGEGENVRQLCEATKSIPGVVESDTSGSTLTIIAPEAEEILAPVILQANALNVKILSVAIQEPNLEAVFLHLTGRALRD